MVAGQQYGYLYDDIGNRKQSLEGGDANGVGLQATTYTANLLNQYSGITTPGVASVNGLANATNVVTMNGAATVRQGEYWWKETSVNNAAGPVWAALNVAASNGGTTNTIVNRYIPKATENPTHDEDGNQTGDGRWIYRWDGENRLVEMETTSTATTAGVPYAKVRWTYDPLGRRIQRESWQGTNALVVTRYVYDGWQCLAELDGSSAVTATYAWGVDISGSRTGAGGVGGLLWVNHTQHGRHFYSYDGNGNVCGLTSATDGTRTGGYEYDPFGGVIRANEAQPVAGWNEWRFSTKRRDLVLGVALFEYRGFGIGTGKWLGRDPIWERGEINLYVSCKNRNTDLIDILGLTLPGMSPEAYPPYPQPIPAPGVLDQFNPFGWLGDYGEEDYTKWFNQRFPQTLDAARSELTRRLKAQICAAADANPSTIPPLNNRTLPNGTTLDYDLGFSRQTIHRWKDAPQDWYERKVQIGSFEVQVDEIRIDWRYGVCGKCFSYSAKMFIIEQTGIAPGEEFYLPLRLLSVNLLSGSSAADLFWKRKVRMAQWDLDGKHCCGDLQ